MLYRVQRRLRDIQELAEGSTGGVPPEAPEKSEPLHLPIGIINPVLNENVYDTAMGVSCVLRALGEIDYEGDIFVDEGDFRTGIRHILGACESALNMHKKYGDHLPHYVVLTDERPPEEGQP
jgi:hypothetical protein